MDDHDLILRVSEQVSGLDRLIHRELESRDRAIELLAEQIRQARTTFLAIIAIVVTLLGVCAAIVAIIAH